MTTPAPTAIHRNLVVQRWGTPDATIGSVNEPREMEENGVWFNEKWIYRRLPSALATARERWVYWHRYDFVASFLVGADGTATREDTAALLAGVEDRLYRPSQECGPGTLPT